MRLSSPVITMLVCLGIAVSFLSFALPAHAVIATVVNELKETEPGSVLEITDVVGLGVKKSFKITLLPGEKKKVSPRNVTAFVVSRVYGDYKEKYSVQCPTDPRVKESVKITLQVLVEDKLDGGCVVDRKGTWTVAGGTQWEAPKNKTLFGEHR